MNKEKFEWIHSWQDNTDKKDLPRILLIGDSITYSYQEEVRELLKGKAYVDYISTSYSIGLTIYNSLIKNFVNSAKYDYIHFNHGLHGKRLSISSYEKKMTKLINFLLTKTKNLILVESTIVKKNNNKKIDPSWDKVIKQRNEIINQIGFKYKLKINHLYEISNAIPNEFRNIDGFHYLENGKSILAKSVSNFLIDLLINNK